MTTYRMPTVEQSVPFKKKPVKAWLLGLMEHWRGVREEAVMNGNFVLLGVANAYVDAYLTVYASLFKPLPPPIGGYGNAAAAIEGLEDKRRLRRDH